MHTEHRSSGEDGTPLLIYGHGSVSTARLLAEHSRLSCVAVDAWPDLVALLSERPFIGLSAMSAPESPGEAGRAIALFRSEYGDTEVTLYNAWDYNVRRAALRAIEYQADGIIMPGIATQECLDCFVAYANRVANHVSRPSTPEEHESILRALTPLSPFWKNQDRIVSPYY